LNNYIYKNSHIPLKRVLKKYTNVFDLSFLKDYIYLNFFVSIGKANRYYLRTMSTFSNSFICALFSKNWLVSRNRWNEKTHRDNLVNFEISEKTVYTNHTPLKFLPDSLKIFIFRKLRSQTTPKFFKFFNLYIIPALESLFDQRVSFRIKPLKKFKGSLKKSIRKIFFKRRWFQSKVGRGFFLNEMLEILFLTFRRKDLNFLKRWFLLTMERIQFKKHKKFLSVFKNIVTKFSDFFIFKNNVKGFFLDVRGKVGVTGDAKKRNFYVSVGKRSKTTKNSRYDYQSGIVRTETGQLGITMIMYY